MLRSNLPQPLSSFVGREKEIAEVASRVQGPVRLLTLTGPGGSGKTRLALEVSSIVAAQFSEAVYWVDLTTVRDPGLVRRTIGQVLGARDDVAEHIGAAETLLVLDNFEQVVEAAPDLADVLQSCPNLHVLVTSRERLRVEGEVEFRVPPLADQEAIDLFCARAGVEPDEAIAALCERLDNLPLAVELAASRSGVLSPRQILGRLSKRLDLFKGGRGAQPRHQTLRATLEWSCQLLTPAELSLFGQLAVFEGGCTLDAAEAVASAELDVLQALVDKSLLAHAGERFSMLETIREYALDQLRATGAEDEARSRHLVWCLAFLDRSERELARSRHQEASRSVEADFANVRAAFAHSLATDNGEAALRIVAHRRVWQAAQGRVAEAVGWAEAALAAFEDSDPVLRATVLAQAGDSQRVLGDLDRARRYLEEAIGIQRDLPALHPLGETLFVLGRVELAAGRLDRAGQVTSESVTLARAAGDRVALGERLAQLGEIAYDEGDAGRARVHAEEALGLAREGGDAHTVADSLRVLAMVERDAGRLAVSQSLAGEAVELQRGLADWNCVSVSLCVLGDLALRNSQHDEANTLFAECLELQRSRRQWYRGLDALWGLAAVAANQGHPRRAAQLLGAEHALRDEAGTRFRLGPSDHHDAVLEAVRRELGDPSFTDAWRAGAAMAQPDALAYALSGEEGEVDRVPRPADRSTGVFRPEGEYWTVRFAADTFRLKDTKGLHHLARLLQHPGREFHVLDLAATDDGASGDRPRRSASTDPDLQPGRLADTGAVLDEQAKRSYQARLRSLEDDLEEATAWSDSGRAAKLQEERDFLVAELASAVGLGGRDRKTGSQAERARVNITRAVKAALSRIRDHSPSLADHLDATVHTGTFCSYSPDPRAPIHWQVETSGPTVRSR